MDKINIKPLRKPKETILSDKDYKQQAAARKESSAILLAQGLQDRFSNLSESAGLEETFSRGDLFKNTKNIGDYVCNILRTSLVSDEAGRIADILLTVPPHRSEDPEILVDPWDERHLRALTGLMYAADRERHFTMLCQPRQVKQVRSWFEDAAIPPERYSISISTFNYSIWAQDAYVALKDDAGKPILCEGVHFPRYDDPTLADDISAQTDKSALQSYLYFQGGNVLEAGDYILIGKDYIEENFGRAHLETGEKILAAFEALLGKPVISVGRAEIIPEEHREYLGGGYFQPIFHIDMYITPTGKKNGAGRDIVAVGSPRLGRAAVGEASKPTDHDIYFDEAADQLAAVFDVVRIPLLPARIRMLRESGEENIRYYYLSFNNSIVENYGGRSNVFLPTFSDEVDYYSTRDWVLDYEGTPEKRQALDQAAKAAWETLGFTVHQMDGLEDLAIGWGSVHCITKTLSRK